jgi:hypothetical protein
MQAVDSNTALTSAAYVASVLGHQATCTLTFKVRFFCCIQLHLIYFRGVACAPSTVFNSVLAAPQLLTLWRISTAYGPCMLTGVYCAVNAMLNVCY